jgi:hypothetical protein
MQVASKINEAATTAQPMQRIPFVGSAARTTEWKFER